MVVDLLKSALTLADMGYRVFPCRVGDKVPATQHGCLDATTDEDQIIEWWETNPEYNVGVSTDGLLVVDVDPLPGGGRNEFADDIDQLASLLISAGTSTPRGGTHFWFRQPAGADLRNTASTIAPGVDTRANGGYVLAPPSKITDSGQYQWMPGFALEMPPQQLATVPDWILALLSDRPANSTPAIAKGGVEPIPDGQRNQTLTSLAGYLRDAGMTQAAIEAALRATNAERCNPPLDDTEVKKIAWSVARYEPSQITTAVAEGWADADTSESTTHQAIDPGDIPRELLQPGGFLGDVIAWNCMTARKPQPELALAAALSLLSVLTGRKVKDDTGTRTNLYCVGLCGSGGGKDHARKVNKKILQASGQERLIGPEGIGSHVGVTAALAMEPALLFQLDEFGRFLTTLQNPSKAPHLYNVITVFLKLFTSSDSLYKGDAVSDMKRVATIDQPHAVLYTTTVPASFFASLTSESLEDGFLARLLVFDAANNDPETSDIIEEDCPRDIAERAKWWGELKTGGNLSGVNAQPRRLVTTPEAKSVFKQLEITSRANAKLEISAAGIWTRAVEKARKLALLWQVSLNPESESITRHAADWGCWLSHHLTSKVQAMAVDWVSENSYEAAHKRLLRLIRAAGENGITTTAMVRSAQWIQKRTRDEILSNLEQGGQIICEKRQNGKAGRPTMVYKAKLR